MTAADIFRVLALFFEALSIGLCAVTIYGNIRSRLRSFIEYPFHIMPITLGILGFTTYILIDSVERFGHQLTWRTPFLILCFSLTNIGLWFIATYQYRKYLTRRDLQEKMPK